MKKFGTPNGAGPGNEKLKVGFDGVGTPFLVRGAGGFVDFFGVVVEPLLEPPEPLPLPLDPVLEPPGGGV